MTTELFLEERINLPFTDRIGQEVKDFIDADPKKFEILMDFYFREEWLINQRTSWFIYPILKDNPQLILPYFDKIIENLKDPHHVSYTRNTMRIFQNIDIPEEYQGILYDYGIALIQDIKEPVANKVFAMTMMYHIAIPFPELMQELKMILETQYAYEMPGYKSRTRKIIKEIDNKSYKKLGKW